MLLSVKFSGTDRTGCLTGRMLMLACVLPSGHSSFLVNVQNERDFSGESRFSSPPSGWHCCFTFGTEHRETPVFFAVIVGWSTLKDKTGNIVNFVGFRITKLAMLFAYPPFTFYAELCQCG
jgi:hypothetical protein